MIAHVKLPDNDKSDDNKNYYCSRCGALITNSSALILLNGSDRHSFMNPAGVRCNFRTFRDCQNVLIDEELYLEHSWFPGYGWRFVMCSSCLQHLGWKYDAAHKADAIDYFFGVLVDSVMEVEEER